MERMDNNKYTQAVPTFLSTAGGTAGGYHTAQSLAYMDIDSRWIQNLSRNWAQAKDELRQLN